MRNLIKITFLALLIASSTSCSEDEPPLVPSASNVITTINENPEDDLSIGTITTNLPDNVTYTLTSESVSGAFSINNATGEVTVNDTSVFDFETNPIIIGVVTVSNGAESVITNITVTLENVDDIASFLTDSKDAYSSAANGDWIAITEEEYNFLATQLNQITKSGATDAHYALGPGIFSGSAWTRVNTTQPSMPAKSLLFAFKYRPNNGKGSGTVVKLSTTSSTQGYMNIGTPFPNNDKGSARNLYYLLKGNNSPINATGYLAIYNPSGGINGANSAVGDVSGQQTANKPGDSNDFSDATFRDDWVFFYQGLSTTQKQWD